MKEHSKTTEKEWLQNTGDGSERQGTVLCLENFDGLWYDFQG